MGCIVGFAANIIGYFLLQDFALKSFLIELVVGLIVSSLAAVLAQLIFPGLKGGGHNSGPTFIGGGDRFSGIGSGIIYTDEELKNKRENERKIP